MDLNQQTGLTVVVSEQNVNFAMSLAGQVYLLETGRIREKGTPEDLHQKLDIAETYFGA